MSGNAAKPKGELTGLQSAFVDHYLETWNATDAARSAGYNGTYDSLRKMGSRNLQNPKIKYAIAERIKDRAMSADEVLLRLGQHARASVSDFMEPVEGDRDFVLNFSKVEKLGYLIKSIKHTANGPEIVLHDPQAALVHIGRHLALFTDKIEIKDWREELRKHDMDPTEMFEEMVQHFVEAQKEESE